MRRVVCCCGRWGRVERGVLLAGAVVGSLHKHTMRQANSRHARCTGCTRVKSESLMMCVCVCGESSPRHSPFLAVSVEYSFGLIEAPTVCWRRL